MSFQESDKHGGIDYTVDKTKDDKDLLDNVIFQQKMGQLRKCISDKDRQRLVLNFADNYIFKTEQALEIVETFESFGSMVMACGDITESCENKDEFIDKAMDLCKYPEDRVAMVNYFKILYYIILYYMIYIL